MPDWILIVPILFPFLAALIQSIQPLQARFRDRALFVLVGVEILFVFLNLSTQAHALTLSRWELGAFSIAFQLDNTSVFLLLVIFVPLFALWLATPPSLPGLGFLIAGAAALLIVSANLMTIFFAWVLLDAALFIWRLAQAGERDSAPRLFALGLASTLLLFAGALFAGAGNPDTGAILVALAFWARLGLFPFHWIAPLQSWQDDLWIARAVPLIAGASLWIHWSLFKLTLPLDWIGILAIVALGASTIWSWRARRTSVIMVATVSQTCVFIPLAVAYGGDTGPALALWLAFGTFLGFACLLLALGWRQPSRRAAGWVWSAGLVSLGQVPLTPAFVGRVGLYVSWMRDAHWGLLVIAAITSGLVLANVWQARLGAEPAEDWPEGRQRQLAALTVLGLSFAILALAPMPVANLLYTEMASSAASALGMLFYPDVILFLLALAVLLLPLDLSFVFRRSRLAAPESHLTPAQAVDVLGFDALIRVAASVGYQMGVAARNVSAIAEENPIIWILLVALWIAIFILIPR